MSLLGVSAGAAPNAARLYIEYICSAGRTKSHGETAEFVLFRKSRRLLPAPRGGPSDARTVFMRATAEDSKNCGDEMRQYFFGEQVAPPLLNQAR